MKSRPARIVYLLTVSGRAVRQVKRQFRHYYDSQDYFLIHVDSRQDLMFRELTKLTEMFPNVRMVKDRRHGLWGGISVLDVSILLRVIGDTFS